MAENLSNEFALDLTLNDVIEESYELLQTIGDGESISGGLFNRALKSINIMLKLWESQGMHLWTITEGSLFLRVGVAINDFRLEGFELLTEVRSTIHLANVFVQRSITADVAVLDLVMTLDQVNDLVVGSQIGLLNDVNDLDWYIVMDITGLIVTLSRALDSAALSGAVVYTYDYFNFSLLTADTVADSIVEVADTTLFNIGDDIAVLLDTNVTEQRTIASIDEGANELTVSLAFTGTASTGQSCVNITTRLNAFKPVKRIPDTMAAVRRRESTDYEIPIVFQSRDDYFGLPNKNQNGTPIQAYYDRQQPQGTMFLWNPPGNATSIINFTYERQLMIFTDPDETFDLSADYFDAVTYGLAKRLIPKVGCSAERKAIIIEGAAEYLSAALAFDSAVYPIRLRPQRYG